MRRRLGGGFTLIEMVMVLAIAALVLAGILVTINSTKQAARDGERKSAVAQVQDAIELWAATHGNSYADPSTGMIVTVTTLYGNCGVGGQQYLDCGVVAPGLGTRYIPQLASSPDPDKDGKFDIMSITDRHGGTTPNDGYCIRVTLEGEANDQAFGVSDGNKVGHVMDDSGGCH